MLMALHSASDHPPRRRFNLPLRFKAAMPQPVCSTRSNAGNSTLQSERVQQSAAEPEALGPPTTQIVLADIGIFGGSFLISRA